ncbi:benzoate-CoA ligase family protein [Cytobacillus depressus]|uniref:Benzoate-CoA ligase family protein n=1 Tax=Cytobacillus depressus TaxID=1602942 RepID=A0A6L3V2P6_9BACI|nr:benzoate-CoA ligase family protein [Cytobacillus depressus]KAB2330497.1 benzoate-CoA ligase family protein [Cytobacillus depressus]
MIETTIQYKGLKEHYNSSYRFIEEIVQKGLGNKVAIYCDDEKVTYQELLSRVNQFGNALKNIGIEPENRMLIVTYDTPEFVVSFFGAIKMGAIPIPVNTMMTHDDFEYFLNNSRARILVIHEDFWKKIENNRDRFIFLKHVIVIGQEKNSEKEIVHFQDFIKDSSDQLEAFKTTFEDPAFWLYSSGSTGNPKGVVHLQRSMESAFNNYAKQILNISENDIAFSASKLFFAYGLGNGMYFPLGAGGSTILLKDRPTPDKVLETIVKYKPTIFFGVPTLFGSIINQVEKTGVIPDLSSVRICVSAGEALPATFINKWKELFNIDILDGIGLTEALHIFLSNRIGDIKPGSTGKVVPGYEAKILNENQQTVSANEIGDLVIKGESLSAGYWCNIAENHRKFHGEWMYTGDKYYQDEEGDFWYCGRSDDMLKVGGIWVSPVEIEATLLHHKQVLEVAVVGAKNENGLIFPKAFVVLKDGVEPTESLNEELKLFVKQNLAPYKYPRVIIFISELPKTATGKIQRFRLKLE